MKKEQIIAAIQVKAKKLWGEEWLTFLVRAYCQLESAEAGRIIKPVNRRSQIVRAIETGSPSLPSLLRLLEAVGLEIRVQSKNPHEANLTGDEEGEETRGTQSTP
jgi:hypothetical protein